MDKHIFNPVITFRDAFLFSILAVLLGFLIDFLFPNINPNETLVQSIILFFLQLFIDVAIILIIVELYIMTFNIHPYTYFGFIVFTLILFMVQPQLFIRLSLIHKDLFKTDLVGYYRGIN